jgi:hypothetical protein
LSGIHQNQDMVGNGMKSWMHGRTSNPSDARAVLWSWNVV